MLIPNKWNVGLLVCNAQDEEPNDDEIFALVSSLKKVAIFWSCHNLGPWNLWDPLFNAVREAKDGHQTMPTEVNN